MSEMDPQINPEFEKNMYELHQLPEKLGFKNSERLIEMKKKQA